MRLFDLPDDRRPWQGGPDPKTLARLSDPDTSKAAALALSGKAGTMRRRLLETFAMGRFTAEDAADIAGFTPADGPWKRISDLLNAGLIEDTGERGWATTGRRQRILAITELGREALR